MGSVNFASPRWLLLEGFEVPQRFRVKGDKAALVPIISVYIPTSDSMTYEVPQVHLQLRRNNDLHEIPYIPSVQGAQPH